MVYVSDLSLEGPGVHSRKGQIFACQCLSIVAQIFAFLVYWEGSGDHISLSALSVCSHRSVGTHMCRQKHAAACRSMPSCALEGPMGGFLCLPYTGCLGLGQTHLSCASCLLAPNESPPPPHTHMYNKLSLQITPKRGS